MCYWIPCPKLTFNYFEPGVLVFNLRSFLAVMSNIKRKGKEVEVGLKI